MFMQQEQQELGLGRQSSVAQIWVQVEKCLQQLASVAAAITQLVMQC
jgi:hypothetical protein